MHWVRPEASTPSWYWQEHHLYMNCNRNKAASGRCWTSRSHCHSPPVHLLALSRTSRSCVPIRSTPVACNSLTEYWNNSIVSPKRLRITHTLTHLYVCMYVWVRMTRWSSIFLILSFFFQIYPLSPTCMQILLLEDKCNLQYSKIFLSFHKHIKNKLTTKIQSQNYSKNIFSINV